MRLCVIKIIFLISTSFFYSQVTQATVSQAKAYDFSFDVKESKASQKQHNKNTSQNPTSNSWRLGMQASLLPDFLKGSGELVYGNFGEHTNNEFSDWDKYLLQLGVSGKRNIFGYGFNFYSVGQQYEGIFNSKYSQKKGRAGYDSWLSLNIDKLQIKAKYLESWTNVADNSNDTYSFDSWYEIESSYPLTAYPLTEVSITYGLGERSKFVVPSYVQTYHGSLNSFKTKFRFVANYLKFSTEAKQFSSTSDRDDQKDFRQETFYVTSTLFPRKLFSLISSYRYSIDSYSNSSYQSKLNKIESSLGLSYKPTTIPFNLKLSSGYKNYQSDDGYTHKDILNFGAQFDWKSKGTYTGLRTDWTVNFKYKDTINYINPRNSSSGLSFNLLWQWPFL